LATEASYTIFRDVAIDFHAKRDGKADDADAINNAIKAGNRCGPSCGNMFPQPAIVYLPPGTYKICKPIELYPYTQLVGDALNLPIIKGCNNFSGVAIINTGAIDNQDQFSPRQIRNLIIDLTEMPSDTSGDANRFVPTGLHWQTSQASSLQNLRFDMPLSGSAGTVTHVGISMENGSGGFASDLEFNGGSIGWRSASQQSTARALKFSRCSTAIQMNWAWGFNWKDIDIDGSAIAFDISNTGGKDQQGVGSISIIDSRITNTAIGIQTIEKTSTNGTTNSSNIVIDNLFTSNLQTIIQTKAGKVLLAGSSKEMTVKLWAQGYRQVSGEANSDAAILDTQSSRPPNLLDNYGDGKLFSRSKPQYDELVIYDFIVATDYGIANDGTGDQSGLISQFLDIAQNLTRVAYFPAGIYRVTGTVFVPKGSRIQGTCWSQIQGTGSYFSNKNDPQVMVQVGEKGDVGSVEIVEMMFGVKGRTPGAILMKWNIQADSKGSGKPLSLQYKPYLSCMPHTLTYRISISSWYVGFSFQCWRSPW
jgi:hypothetical protein